MLNSALWLNLNYNYPYPQSGLACPVQYWCSIPLPSIVEKSHLFYMDRILETESYPKMSKLWQRLLVTKLHKITKIKITMGKITHYGITQGNLFVNMKGKCHIVKVKVTIFFCKSCMKRPKIQCDFAKIYPSLIFLHGNRPQRWQLFACLLPRHTI